MYFQANAFPRLKGRGAEVKSLGKPLEQVFLAHMDPDDRVHRFIHLGLQYSIRMEENLDENQYEFCLSPAAHEEFQSSVFNFLAVVTALGQHFHNQGILLFHFTIKNHYLAHIAIYSKWFNPRAAWCYSGEDFMQRVRKIVASCQRGTAPDLVCSKAMEKYKAGLEFTLLENELWLGGEVADFPDVD